MAVVSLSSCLPRIHPQPTRDALISDSGSPGELVASSRLGLGPWKREAVQGVCSLGCSSRVAAGRESPAGGNSGSEWSQQSGLSRRWFAGGPARAIKINREAAVEKQEEESDDEDDSELCPVECVREFKSRSEFDDILQQANRQNALVVVDFFKTACGSCRYIETGFTKLCKGAGNTDVSVIFLKHNVMDEYEEQSEVAESLKIRVVPLFHFYKGGQLVESFATREKAKILDAICKYTGLQVEDILLPGKR